MKILHIISSGGMYGAEAVILNLSSCLIRQGHQAILGVFDNLAERNLQLAEAAERAGLEVHRIVCNGQVDRTTAERIRTVVAATGADIVHAHGYKADLYAFLAMRGRDAGLVSTCHNWLDTDWKVKVYGALDRRVLREYDCVVGVSSEVRKRLLDSGVEPDRIIPIENGIDDAPFAEAKPVLREELGLDDQLLTGFVGRLSKEKGADLFLRAAAKVLERLPAVHFVVVGDGPDRASLESLVKQLGIEKQVTLLGRRTDIPGVLASLDLLVSASRTEGLPMALLEAMASGRAVVATEVGEVARVVSEGKTGLLVQSEDVLALAGATLRLLEDPALRRQMGVTAKEDVAKRFSASAMTACYVDVYERALRLKMSKEHGRRPQ